MRKSMLRWGILGSADIAVRSVIPGIAESDMGEVVAIASRSAAKAKSTAADMNIPRWYGSYAELLADENVDAVYIPLPNHLHCEWTLAAVGAKKHVLCEKPMALDAGEAARMEDAAKSANVVLAEAFMYRYAPRIHRLREFVRDGSIGELRAVRSGFTFHNAEDYANVRYRREMGGGSIYDVGCYPLSMGRFLFEEEPSAVTVQALFSNQHDDVDMMASGLVEFGGGASLTFDCGMWAAGRNFAEVVGTEGRLELPNAFTGDTTILLWRGREAHALPDVETFPRVNHYALQADAFARAVFGQEALEYPAADAVANMRLVDACLKSARERQRIVLAP